MKPVLAPEWRNLGVASGCQSGIRANQGRNKTGARSWRAHRFSL